MARSAEQVIAIVDEAFRAAPYPGDPFLIGSNEGCEPAEVAQAFAGRTDWRVLSPEFLDEQYVALSFFSEGALRFYLPAYLTADLRGALRTADPVFPLTGQFAEWRADLARGVEAFSRRHGGTTLLNPRRYGAMRDEDYARFRLSVFAREEAAAIVAYLEWRSSRDPVLGEAAQIAAALDRFWRPRALAAPTLADIDAHLREEARFMAAVRRDRE